MWYEAVFASEASRNILRFPMVFNSNIKQIIPAWAGIFYDFVSYLTEMWKISPLRSNRAWKYYEFLWYLTEIWNKSVFCEQSEQGNVKMLYGI